jgi:chromate reductase
MKVLGISGSLRHDGYNTRLLDAAAKLAPPGVELQVWDAAQVKAVPPYDEDDEKAGVVPVAVARLRAAIAGADAVLFSTPEYNSSVPGQLKNVLDWVSRPIGANALRNKPVAVVGASAGAFGAVWAQAELRKVLSAMGTRVTEGELALGHADRQFDADGSIADAELREQLRAVLETLVADTGTAIELAS